MSMLDETNGDFVTWCKAQAAITALVGADDAARIWPAKAKSPEQLPYVVYTGIGGESLKHLEGESGNGETVIQVSAFATLPSQASTIIEAIRELRKVQKSKTAMPGVWIDWVQASRAFTGHDEPKTGQGKAARFWSRVTINIMHGEEPT